MTTAMIGRLRLDNPPESLLVIAGQSVWWYEGSAVYHTSGRPQFPHGTVRIGTVHDALAAGCERRCEIGDCRRVVEVA